MSQPVKLSDSLVLDARIASEIMERSIAGQVEFWARLGRSVELLLDGQDVLKLRRNGAAQSITECVESVDTAEGRAQLESYLESLPYPHYRPHPTKRGLLECIDEDGTRTLGRFVNRQFKLVRDPGEKLRK